MHVFNGVLLRWSEVNVVSPLPVDYTLSLYVENRLISDQRVNDLVSKHETRVSLNLSVLC